MKLVDGFLQALAADKSHRIVRAPIVVLAKSVDRHDSRVFQGSGDIGTLTATTLTDEAAFDFSTNGDLTDYLVSPRVGYLGVNHPALLETMFAAQSLGAIFVPLNFRLTAEELTFIINDAGVHTLVVDDSLPVLRAAHAWGIGRVVAIRRPDTTRPAREVTDFHAVDALPELGTPPRDGED